MIRAFSALPGEPGRSGRTREAVTGLETLLEDQRRLRGDDDPVLAKTRSQIARWKDQGRRQNQARNQPRRDGRRRVDRAGS